ncbi:isochorismate synthase [Actinomadura macra]|uniref:isochorismate synthase n=1 Tax=Actinomadura macra TaxID=46164 RepID=UPI00082CE1AA|nr:isochorismate synthase [Actinomadura macra]
MSNLTHAPRGIDPLDGYRPGRSFFFRSPRHTLLAQGVLETLPSCNARDPATMLMRMRTTLDRVADDHPRPMLVGAIPFRADIPARLTVPSAVQWTRSGSVSPVAGPITPSYSNIEQIPSPHEYKQAVTAALEELRNGHLEKVMLARSVRLNNVMGADPGRLLRHLAHDDPDAYVFAVDLLAGRVLIGTSPELLVRRSGALVSARPLAGSAPRHPDPARDTESGQALLNSDKDLREHAVVVEAVAGGLNPYCAELTIPDRPALVKTATMWHLSTQITGRLASPEISSLHLFAALHPAPAVCGTPAAEARALIKRIEKLNRGFYSGAVGWCDVSGDGEWAMTFRCAEVSPSETRIYAGADVVADSTPDGELAETSAELQTMLRALGIDPNP